jgi:hypothetical protein
MQANPRGLSHKEQEGFLVYNFVRDHEYMPALKAFLARCQNSKVRARGAAFRAAHFAGWRARRHAVCVCGRACGRCRRR